MSGREVFRENLETQVNRWKDELGVLKARAADLGGEARGELQEQIDELQHTIDEGLAKLEQVTEATDETWDSMEGEVKTGWDALAAGHAAAVLRFPHNQ